jgi:putative ATP-dependent endonuclease of OLD family
MQIRRLSITRYRGLQEFIWKPAPGVNCLIGPGDSGKSTVLSALSLLFTPSPPAPPTEFDYFKRRVDQGFQIEAVVAADLRAIAPERAVLPVRGWLNDELVDLPDENGAEPVLVCRVRGTTDMEIMHEVLPVNGEALTFSVGFRKKLMLARLASDERSARDLRVGAGSLLDRFLGRMDLRPTLHRAVAAAAQGMQLPQAVTDALERLSANFDDAGLPHDLHLGIVPGPGTSLPGMLTLLQGNIPAEAIPLPQFGTGTRQLALLTLSSSLAGAEPLVIADELERGLEPHRQRLATQHVIDLVAQAGHGFVTTHSPTVIRSLPPGSVWRMSAASPIRFEGEILGRFIHDEPEAFFSPLPIFCEGDTEIGFLEVLLPQRLNTPLDNSGIRLVDGRGQPDILDKLDAFIRAGMTVCAFLDNEPRHTGRRQRTNGGCTQFCWAGVCNIEEAVALHLPLDELPTVLAWGAEAREFEARHLAVQVRDKIAGAASYDFHDLAVAHGEAALRNGLYRAMVDHTWFKSRAGGRVLARRLQERGMPAFIEAQLADFVRRVREKMENLQLAAR